jgi:hypothetical protein
MKEAMPIGQSGQVSLRTRLFHLEVRANEHGNPVWDENAYPGSFNGGVVLFITKGGIRGDDICEGLEVDRAFPEPVAEAECATTAGV